MTHSEAIIKSELWAKKKEVNGLLYWLPLQQHLIDTMNVSGQLWEQWLSEGQRKKVIMLLSDPNEETAKKMVRFLGAVHDIGKASPAFQGQRGYISSNDLDKRLIEQLEQSGFTDLSLLNLTSANMSKHALAGQALLSSYGVRDDIASVVGGHHGRPIDDRLQSEEQLLSYTANYFQEENPQNPNYREWDMAQRNVFNWALRETGFNNADSLPEIQQPALVILQGLLIMADWIASNEYYFPLYLIDEAIVIDQKSRFKNGWSKWFKTHPWESQNIIDAEKSYQRRFGFKPRDIQKHLVQIITESVNPGIFVVEAPMGVGKTEAALIAVEQLASKTGRSGMFFGLPTQATSNGIFLRIKSWLENISSSDGEYKSLQLVHGKAALNDDFAEIMHHNQVTYDKANGNNAVIVNDWFIGRKSSILDDFVVGTVDQFLLSALKQKHLALRHLGFSKKVVVIDEVHAYDAYMGQYLYQAIRWMGVYGVPVIILSATLPAKRREDLIDNYMRGTGIRSNARIIASDKWDSTNAYPLITYTDGNQIKQERDVSVIEGKTIQVRRLDDTALIDTVNDLLSDGGVIGIIVNTVRRSQDLACQLAEVFGEDTVELLHSSFISTDRIEKEKKLLQIIGKEAQRPQRKIVVGTQVIEQSLDIDFDVLISDLAPMDLLLQRIGRLHRHQLHDRPKKLGEPKVYVLGTHDSLIFEEGSVAVYGEYLLMRTQFYLQDVINLPGDISDLVQKVYEGEDIVLGDELNQKYWEAKDKHNDLIEKKEERAKHFRIERPNKPNRDSLIAWLKNLIPEDSEERGYAQVRDSSDSIEVIAVKEYDDTYSLFGEAKDISKNIQEFATGKRLAMQTLRLPNPLSSIYRIDKTIKELEKYNSNHLADWQKSTWLKGSLGIIFDTHNQFTLNGYRLTYDRKYGLKYEREEKNEEI